MTALEMVFGEPESREGSSELVFRGRRCREAREGGLLSVAGCVVSDQRRGTARWSGRLAFAKEAAGLGRHCGHGCPQWGSL